MKHDFKVYLRLLSYLKPYWGVAILVVVGFAINAATEVSVAKLLEKIIEAIQHRDQGFTTLFPILVVVVMFFRGLGLFMGGILRLSFLETWSLIFAKKFLQNYCVFLHSIIWIITVVISLRRSCLMWSSLPLHLQNH